jgi:peptidoglycan hydrolase-like protein with peptidoglycan-binding domain
VATGVGGNDGGPAGPAGLVVPASRRRLVQVAGVAAAVAGIVIAGGIYLYVQKPSPAHAAGDKPAKPHDAVPRRPEHVVSITPEDGTTAVNGAAAIRVEFSAPLSPTSPMPTLKPAIDGTWQRDGNTAIFVPDRGYRPRTKVIVRVPAGRTGVTSAGGGLLAAPVTAKFRTGKYSSVRLEQLLAQLGYLPLTWSPLSGSSEPPSKLRAQISAAYQPPAGTYTWQTGYPSQLTGLWRPAKPSLILRGAVIAFEADHHLTLDGVIGPNVWRAMFSALVAGQMNTHGYTYALASQKLPETLTVWHNGHIIFHHLANTGIPAAPTAVGTDPVYLRYRFQIMRGRNPDGTKYADPVAWVAYFHAGEAVHYFPRYSYGSQQSLGCVELPYQPAKRIWPYLTFGTLVTVTGP